MSFTHRKLKEYSIGPFYLIAAVVQHNLKVRLVSSLFPALYDNQAEMADIYSKLKKLEFKIII